MSQKIINLVGINIPKLCEKGFINMPIRPVNVSAIRLEMDFSQRLKMALDLLGYDDASPKHIRHILVTQIQSFAAMNNDVEIESQAEFLANKIKEEPQG